MTFLIFVQNYVAMLTVKLFLNIKLIIMKKLTQSIAAIMAAFMLNMLRKFHIMIYAHDVIGILMQ